MMHKCRWAAGLAMLTAIWSISSRTEGQDAPKNMAVVNNEVFKALVVDAAGNIQKAIAKKDKKSLRKAQTEAALIAGYAQFTHGGPSAEERAGIRDAALKLVAALQGNKTDEATKVAEQLAAYKGESGAKPGDVDIMVKANLDHTDIMKQFANPPTGYGIDIHFKKITNLGNRIPEKEFTTELLGESYKAAVAMHMLKTYKFPENPKVFAKLVDAALEPSARWAEAVGKKDGAGGSRMVYETTLACGACHKTYR
jgi:hypothetical protein